MLNLRIVGGTRSYRGRLLWLWTLLVMANLAHVASGQEFFERMSDWPRQLKIKGTVVVAALPTTAEEAGQALPNSLRQQRIVVISDAAPEAPAMKHVVSRLRDVQAEAEWVSIAQWREKLSASALDKVPFVCVAATRPFEDDVDADLNSALGSALQAVIRRGGTVIGLGYAAPMTGKRAVVGNDLPPRLVASWNLIPDGVVMLHYGRDEKDIRRMASVLGAYPGSVGVGIEPDGTLVLSGRKCTVRGSGEALFMVGANERQPIRTQRIRAPRSRSDSPEDVLLDWTQWRRMAMELTLPPFPPDSPPPPRVENGTLVIVGGGGLPDGLMERFIELAGGKDKARLVYVPCSEREQLSPRQSMVEQWKAMGVQHATWIHTKDRERANSDEEFLKPLKDATGIWFGGGRQWNFADSYYGTQAHRLMKEVLRRGGVIGGSSAGASIQASYLARATPIQNFRIMAPGYERGGLGFIRGVAIDQHFTQRGRQKDMTELMRHYPQLLGIGIDERTAIIVQGSIAEVTGAGRVFFYDRTKPVYPDRPDYIAVEAGNRFDLVERKVLSDGGE